MKDDRRQRLLDEYEEAALKFLLNEYADADGERLWQEYKVAEETGEVLDVPNDLDRKCRQIIQGSFAKYNRRVRSSQILRALSKVAVIVLVLLGLSTTLVLSVDALRVPVLNFFLRHSDRYTAITLNEENTVLQSELENIHNSIGYLIPDEYTLVFEEVSGRGSMNLLYQNDLEEVISLKITMNSGQLFVDTEDAYVEDITLNEQPAVLVEKEGFRVVWSNQDKKLSYDLYAEALEVDVFWKIAYALAS